MLGIQSNTIPCFGKRSDELHQYLSILKRSMIGGPFFASAEYKKILKFVSPCVGVNHPTFLRVISNNEVLNFKIKKDVHDDIPLFPIVLLLKL